MASYIKGEERGQLVLFTENLEDRIPIESEARTIDLFVENLELNKIGIKRSNPNKKGTKHYDPRDLLKLYLYGYTHKVRSSRKLEELCRVNIEVIWLMRGIEPDFRTISNFRKENAKELKKVFKEMLMMCGELDLLGEINSQDGVKIQAVNAKERNYTLNKIDDRLNRLEKTIEEYLKQMDEIDKEEQKGKEKIISKKELEKRIEEKRKKKEEYEKIKKEIEEKGEKQKSLTDKDSRLMKNNGKFCVCYNVQVLVNEKSHIVVNYKAGSNPGDIGSMEEVNKEAKEIIGEEKVTRNITDQGYKDREDMARCLEEGIIPEVTLGKEEKSYEIEFAYEENEITEEIKGSRKKEDIKRSLRAGIIPEVYKEYLSEIKVVEKTICKTIEEAKGQIEELDNNARRDLAIREKCFVKNEEESKVYCPEGEILRPKSNHKDGIKYCNKLACKNCKNPCTVALFKEITMKKGQNISSTNKKELKEKYNSKKKRKKEKVKVVVCRLTPKAEDLKKRMSISEHSHGTMKRNDDAYYFLMKGVDNVNGELAIYYSASNLRRMRNILGIKKINEYLEKKIQEKEKNLYDFVNKLKKYVEKEHKK